MFNCHQLPLDQMDAVTTHIRPINAAAWVAVLVCGLVVAWLPSPASAATPAVGSVANWKGQAW
jgi:hypothetical protein